MSVQGRDLFRGALRRRLNPVLRSLGFRGSGGHFIRTRGVTINALNIQGSKSADGCFLNLGLHFDFLPPNWLMSPRPDWKWKEIDCELRWRVRAPNRDGDMWPYGETAQEAEQQAADLVEQYSSVGEPVFERFASPAAVAEVVTLETLRKGRFEHAPWHTTQVREAMTMARIHQWLGSPDRAAEFARLGLEHLGSAAGLRATLLELAGAI